MNAVTAYVALGANLGDARASVEAAMAAIAGLPGSQLRARASMYRTAPLDAGGPDYVNAVVELHTTLPPLELLHRLQAIEQAYGRERSVRNAPRTLDLDLLLWGDVAMQTTELTLPHPRLHLRAFVLQPLVEIAPAVFVPGLGALRPWLEQTAGQQIERLCT